MKLSDKEEGKVHMIVVDCGQNAGLAFNFVAGCILV